MMITDNNPAEQMATGTEDVKNAQDLVVSSPVDRSTSPPFWH